MDHASGNSEDESYNPSISIKEEPIDMKDSLCSESVSEHTDCNVKDDQVTRDSLCSESVSEHTDCNVKDDQVTRDEDLSDATDPVSSCGESDIHEMFSWAFDPENEAVEGGETWRFSDLPWQTDASTPALKPFMSYSGTTDLLQDIGTQNATPLEHFHMFVPKALFRVACKETNNYAEFYQDQKRDIGRELWDWTDPHWTPVEDEDEMRKFLAICMVMSVKRLPHPQDYWSNVQDLREKLVADIMSPGRFSKLMQYFYVSNPWRDPERIANPDRRAEACFRDPLYKLSDALWSPFQNACKTMYDPHQDIILRQLLITDNQQCRNQDDLWKALTIEDATNGYIKNIEFHKVENQSSDSVSFSVYPSEEQVSNLLPDIAARDHCVYADSVFISPETACKLADCGFQISANYSSWPVELSDDSMSLLSSGENKSLHYKEAVATAWKTDSGIHRHLRTFDDGQCVVDNPESRPSMFPPPVDRHNAIVKFNDSRYLLFKSDLLTRMTKSDWKRMFWVILDIALTNASVTWKESGRDPLSLPEFTMKVARGLIKEESSTKRKFAVGSDKKSGVRIPQIVPTFQQMTPGIVHRSALMQAKMAKTRAQIQKDYRERKKRNNPAFLEKERKRQKLYWVPASELSHSALTKRREKNKMHCKKYREKSKKTSENPSFTVQTQDVSSSTDPQPRSSRSSNSPPLLIQIPLLKKDPDSVRDPKI